MGNDYQRREEWRQRYDWSKGQARGGWGILTKQDNLPPFAKSANAMHIEMTEHSTRNK